MLSTFVTPPAGPKKTALWGAAIKIQHKLLIRVTAVTNRTLAENYYLLAQFGRPAGHFLQHAAHC